MAKLEMVIRALECCGSIMNCEECPYNDKPVGCFTRLKSDALELLKAQQPRVIPLKELADEANHCFDVVWYEVKGGNVIPRRVQPCGHMLKVKSFYTEPFLSDGATYNVTWRCWTARPTDEQREATPWDEQPKEGKEE